MTYSGLNNNCVNDVMHFKEHLQMTKKKRTQSETFHGYNVKDEIASGWKAEQQHFVNGVIINPTNIHF